MRTTPLKQIWSNAFKTMPLIIRNSVVGQKRSKVDLLQVSPRNRKEESKLSYEIMLTDVYKWIESTGQCNSCGMYFSRASSLKDHNMKCHSVPEFACEQCKQLCVTKDNFKIFKWTCTVYHVHGKKQHVCEECGQIYHRRGAWLNQLLTQTGFLVYMWIL
jgi:hypothetical protein